MGRLSKDTPSSNSLEPTWLSWGFARFAQVTTELAGEGTGQLVLPG